MKITVKAFGPEAIALIGREIVIHMNSSSTLSDLIRSLEEKKGIQQGLAQRITDSSLTILVNGDHVNDSIHRTLKDGDIVVILSPIGGGCWPP